MWVSCVLSSLCQPWAFISAPNPREPSRWKCKILRVHRWQKWLLLLTFVLDSRFPFQFQPKFLITCHLFSDFENMFLKYASQTLICNWSYLVILVKNAYCNSAGLGWALVVRISNIFQANADVFDTEATVWVAKFYLTSFSGWVGSKNLDVYHY